MTKASVFEKKQYSNPETDRVIAESGSKFTAKVFLYMFIAIAITALTTIIGTVVLDAALINGSETAINVVTGVSVGAFVLYLPLFIWIQISVLRGGKGLTPAFVIYSILMGALISPIIWLLSAANALGLVGMAFGITVGAFGIMSLIAFTSKKNLSFLGVIGFGLLSGIMLIALVSLVLSLFGVTGEVLLLDALVSLGFFVFVILITLVDLYNIRSIAARGAASDNIAMVCAFSLYTDFVYIFIRILLFIIRLALVFGNRN